MNTYNGSKKNSGAVSRPYKNDGGFQEVNTINGHADNKINDSNDSDNDNDSNIGGKSLKSAFNEYLSRKKTSRPSPQSKTDKMLEFTHPQFDEDVFNSAYENAEGFIAGDAKRAGDSRDAEDAKDAGDIIDGFSKIGDASGGVRKNAGYGGGHDSNPGGFGDFDNDYGGAGEFGGFGGDPGDFDGDPGDFGGDPGDGELVAYDGGLDDGYGDGDPGGYDDDYPGDFGGALPDNGGSDYYESGGDYDASGAESGDDHKIRLRDLSPREIALKFLRLAFLAIKWVLIYMGRFILTVLKTSIIIILVFMFGFLGAGVGAIYGYLQDIEPVTNITLEMKIQSSYIYDADGNQIARLTGSGNVNRQLVRYNEISPYLPKALIAIEDKRFESHNGVDPKRIMSAGLQFILGGSDAHGASTITQQLVKNVTGKKDETLERKVQEWYLAIELEKTMEKWKILELYLNVVYFGNSNYGVSSASRTYFGKSVGDLSLAESAFLIGITNSPGTYNPFSENGYKNAMKRQATILNEMLSQGMISDEEYDEAMEEPINIIPKSVTTAVATKPNSYFVDCVIEEVKNDLMSEKGMTAEMALAQIYNYGLKIYTTQRPPIQAALDSVFNDPQYFPDINPDAQKNSETPQGAMVILDPNSSRIIAIAGGYGEKLADRTFNRATQARRQPGSSIKPIAVFGPALDQKAITLASVADDSPAHLDPNNPDKIYPSNSTGDFRGLTTMRNAIRRSVNVIASKTWLTIPETSHRYLDKAGINRDSETQVALSLGGLHKGVTPLEMAAAYVPFVNRGMYYEPTTYTKVLDSNGRILLDKTVRLPTIVYSEQTAYLMTSALEDVIISGTGTQAALFDGLMPAAGKTGTTNDNADRWFVGYTPYYVASTWYGYDNRIKKIALTQEELGNAMIIWRTVMEKIHEGLLPKEFPMPDQIVTANVCAYSGKAPSALCRNDPRGNAIRTEIFAAGTEPDETDPCDVHISTQVCAEGSEAAGMNVAAGAYCPSESIETRVSIKRTTPFIPEQGDPYPSDWMYEYASLPSCPYHTEYGISPEFAPELETEDEQETSVPDEIENGEGEPGEEPGTESSDIAGIDNDADVPTRPLRTPRPGRNIPVTDLIGESTTTQPVQTEPPSDGGNSGDTDGGEDGNNSSGGYGGGAEGADDG